MRTWVVTINRNWEHTVFARTAADAATDAGDQWRAEHTAGEDVGGIEDLEVRLVPEEVRRDRETATESPR